MKTFSLAAIFDSLTFENKIKVILNYNENWIVEVIKSVESKKEISGSKKYKIIHKNYEIYIESQREAKKIKYNVSIEMNLQIDIQDIEVKNIKDKEAYKFEFVKLKSDITKKSVYCESSIWVGSMSWKIYNSLLQKNSNERIRNDVIRNTYEELCLKHFRFHASPDKKIFFDSMVQPGFGLSTLPKFLEYIYFNRFDLIRTFDSKNNDFKTNVINWFVDYGFEEMKFILLFNKAMFIDYFKQYNKLITQGVALIGFENRSIGLSQNLHHFKRGLEKIKKDSFVFDVPNSELIYLQDKHISSKGVKLSDLNNYKYKLYFLNPLEYFDLIANAKIVNYDSYVYWAWELEDFPQYLVENKLKAERVLSVSEFSSKSISKTIDRKVETIHIPMNLKRTNNHRNQKYFLFIFDYLSDFQRKNPLAVIEAYVKAFPKRKTNLKLVIKTSNHQLRISQHEKLIRACQDRNDIVIVTRKMTTSEINSLIESCQGYVSLHRAEGFGIPLAMAMMLEKPVIATGYSGNLDFMSETNSFLVDYSMISTKNATELIYQNLQSRWADPDVEAAARFMQIIDNDDRIVKKIGIKGSVDIKNLLSFERFGKKISTLLK
jgi:glycosyltransferase involved in cell wall biosynthesis